MNTPEGKLSWTVPAAMYVPTRESESRQNNFLRVQDVMILDVLRTNWDPARTPVPKPVYFAVTVANSNMVGLRDHLTFEGLVFRVNPKGRQPVDSELLRRNLLETFDGHFRGINDPKVHFDDNVEKLLQNYRSGYLQLAYYYSTLPDTNASAGSQYESLTERVANFDRLSNRQRALTVMMKLDELVPESVRVITNPELSLQIAKMYYDMGRPDEMIRRLEQLTARKDLRLEMRMRVAGFWAAYGKNAARSQELMDQALGSAPTAEQCYAAGRELFTAGSYAMAAQCFEKALALNPNDGQSIGALMQAYEYSGNKSRAVAVLQDWVARHPSDRGAKQRLDQMMAADTGAPRAAN
jgi:hypothetical protein